MITSLALVEVAHFQPRSGINRKAGAIGTLDFLAPLPGCERFSRLDPRACATRLSNFVPAGLGNA
jgi:hypothetical protein